MWCNNQWLWDKEKALPCQFKGITLSLNNLDSKAIFSVKYPDHKTTHYPFEHYSFWSGRFQELYNRQGEILPNYKIQEISSMHCKNCLYWEKVPIKQDPYSGYCQEDSSEYNNNGYLPLDGWKLTDEYVDVETGPLFRCTKFKQKEILS